MLCEFHHNPQLRYPTLHIAGTNGKGTTAHTLAALLIRAGYRTGLYTSPHLQNFSERIQINGKFIAESDVISYTEQLKPLIEELKPSFFEITVAMALQYFAKKGVDIAVVETGLGGRWDSTNILDPLLCLITNISLDHAEVLGFRLSQIAYEKAGIIKKGVPVLLGPVPKETLPIFEAEARQKQASLLHSTPYRIHTKAELLDQRVVDVYRYEKLYFSDLKLGLTADYYVENLPLILRAAEQLSTLGFGHTKDHLRETLSKFSLKGRFQWLSKAPRTICDVAHNAAGLRSLVAQLQRLHTQGRWHIIFGLSQEKLSQDLLRLLPPQALYYATQAQVARAYRAEKLAADLQAVGLKARAYTTWVAAWEAAQAAAKKEDLLLICGSLYLVAEFSEL